MPLPDQHANESTVEVDRDLVKLLRQASEAITAWEKERERLKLKLIEQMGDAYAGTVDGVKVVSYRPKDQYALGRLQKDYPDLVSHFMTWKTREVLDLDRFSASHAEILEQYKVRAFVELA